MSKVVFVGNVPYNFGESELKEVFETVGQVIGFRLVYDRETNKPKGYGFAEFSDHETAMSAVRNLNGQDVGGRPLRIDLAESDPFLEGKTTVRGELPDGGESRSQWREREERGGHGPEFAAFMANPPPGVHVPPGKAKDSINHTVANTNPEELRGVLIQMKNFISQHPGEARALLNQNPQFSYAMYQAMVSLNIIRPDSIPGMVDMKPPPPPPMQNYPPPPPQQQHYPPVPQYHAPPPPQNYPPYGYAPPPPMSYPPPGAAFHQPTYQPPPHLAAAPPAAAPGPEHQVITEEQKAQIKMVLAMSPDTLAAMAPGREKDAIIQLRTQFAGFPL